MVKSGGSVSANSNYLVSVVIATHNRSRYAIDCIRSILEVASECVQVAVHDTSSDACELKSWASEVVDSRLRYAHSSERLSMTENHEKALRLAQGEYICLIGDDDTVSKRIVDVAMFAQANNIHIMTPPVKATYYWPDFRTKFYGDKHAGKVYLDNFSGEVTYINLSDRLELALSQACQGTDRLPKLYHGLVHKSIIEKIRQANDGVMLYGTSPDISASVSICLVGGKNYCEIDFPFTMPGGSAGSNSGRSALGKHKGDLKTDPHLAPFKNLIWPDEIPKFFSVETVWAHAAWETLKHSKSQDEFNRFGLSRLYALCLFNHWDSRRYTFTAWRASRQASQSNNTMLKLSVDFATVASSHVLSRIKRLANPSPSNGREVVCVVPTVYEARKNLDENLDIKLKALKLPYIKL